MDFVPESGADGFVAASMEQVAEKSALFRFVVLTHFDSPVELFTTSLVARLVCGCDWCGLAIGD